jgi:phosphatidylserine/phosphatidylglycerophosphate/cardiolipin synthase-like enzyme
MTTSGNIQGRFEVHFGGPGHPAGALRELLSEHVTAAPPGSVIDWATYYFRDRLLAQALTQARRRGVQVTLVMEARPRVARANHAVIALLTESGGLESGLRLVRMRGFPSPPGIAWKPQMHEKIYCFSHPEPVAFVGSFNPSSDLPEEDPGVVAAIGDHHIAHNALVEIRDPAIVDCLTRHVRALHEAGPWSLWRKQPGLAREHDFGDTQLYFWPRRGQHPVEQVLERCGAGDRVRIAASHIRNPGSVACLQRLARRGAQVEIAAEHTTRRVPRRMERRLHSAGIKLIRLGADANVPMHLKFVLVEGRHGRQAVFGSFNWTLPSYWLNHEVAVVTRDEAVFAALDRRWQTLGLSGGTRAEHGRQA